MRDTIFELEARVQHEHGYRRDVVFVQRAILEARIEDARRALAELLARWPMS